MPLSLRDVIWIKEDQRIEELDNLELKKSELGIVRERWNVFLTILSDLRHIQLSKMYFKTDASFKDFLTTLPSFKGEKKEKEELRWKIVKRKPGELPEWKKKALAESDSGNNKKTD